MNSIFLTNIRNILNFTLSGIVLFFMQFRERKIIKNTMLVIRLDSIGDYLLFRNFLKILKEDKKYDNYKITLCGNIIWKELAEKLDSDVIDHFIWLKRKEFLYNIGYKISFLKMIYSMGFETVINSTYTREILFGDQIVKATGAIERIGNSGSPDKKKRVKIFSNKFYTKLIPASGDSLFEFYRNKEFFESLLNKKINIKHPEIDSAGIVQYPGLSGRYCVVFPGSNEAVRRWSTGNFAKICEYLISEFKLSVVIPLAGNEKHIADEITKIVNNNKLIDLTGKASLSELAKIISDSELTISNDTAAVHIAAALNKNFLCISNGSYIGRFLPYPEEIFSKGNYLFPEEIMKDLELSADKYINGSSLDINKISVDKVKDKIKLLLA